MLFSSEQARACAREALKRLSASRSNQDRMLYATAQKLGIEEVISELAKKGGVISKRFDQVGRYLVSIDDMRRVIHGMRSATEAAKAEANRLSFA